MPKIGCNEMKPGVIVEYRDRLWAVVKTDHVKPGKGPAYVQAELKEVVDGTKLNERFRAADTIERVRLEQRDMQFLYDEGDTLALMDQESFEQTSVPRGLVGDALPFLQEGMVLQVETHEGRPLGIRLPETVVLTVVEADPVVKGQTAAASYKPAILDNGVRIMVPPHIETGTKVVVNTTDSSYVERFKG